MREKYVEPIEPAPSDSQPEELYTYDEVSSMLKVSKNTLYFWVAQGVIPHVRLGPRTVRFRRSELHAWLQGNGNGGRRGPQ